MLAYLARKSSEEKVGTESLEQPVGHQGSSNSSEGALPAAEETSGNEHSVTHEQPSAEVDQAELAAPAVSISHSFSQQPAAITFPQSQIENVTVTVSSSSLRQPAAAPPFTQSPIESVPVSVVSQSYPSLRQPAAAPPFTQSPIENVSVSLVSHTYPSVRQPAAALPFTQSPIENVPVSIVTQTYLSARQPAPALPFTQSSIESAITDIRNVCVSEMSGQAAAMFPNFGTTSILVKNPVQSNMHGEQAPKSTVYFN